MRVLVTGANGMLGHALLRTLPLSGKVVPLTRQELDISQFDDVQKCLRSHHPDVVVNTAAYTDVDGCETNEPTAFAINAAGPFYLALACRAAGCSLVHISSDYVFDGNGATCYQEEDPPDPQSAYGRSKLAGEILVRQVLPAHYIIRTSWLFGPCGRHFVGAIMARSRAGKESGVVNDQIGSPTYTLDLAEAITKLIRTNRFGIYHLTNAGCCSWYDLARLVLQKAGLPVQLVQPVSSVQLGRPAPRPAYSVLANTRWQQLGLTLLRPYQEALAAFLEQES